MRVHSGYCDCVCCRHRWFDRICCNLCIHAEVTCKRRVCVLAYSALALEKKKRCTPLCSDCKNNAMKNYESNNFSFVISCMLISLYCLFFRLVLMFVWLPRYCSRALVSRATWACWLSAWKRRRQRQRRRKERMKKKQQIIRIVHTIISTHFWAVLCMYIYIVFFAHHLAAIPIYIYVDFSERDSMNYLLNSIRHIVPNSSAHITILCKLKNIVYFVSLQACDSFPSFVRLFGRSFARWSPHTPAPSE